MKTVISKHAREMLILRGISQKWVEQAVRSPEITNDGNQGTKILYRRYGMLYLKVITKAGADHILIITAHFIDKKRIKEVVS